MTAYDSLSEQYDSGRIGYAHELYTTLVQYGLAPSHKVLDVACGTALAAAPLIANSYDVTGVDASEPMLARARARFPGATFVRAEAEALPFEDGTFDAAISGQAFHHVDRTAAFREVLRVLRPGGIVAIWWKHLLGDDAFKTLRDAILREMGFEPPVSGLKGGFKEFYAAPLREHTLRIIPWSASARLSKLLQAERSRMSLVELLGSKFDAYISTLQVRARETFGADDPPIALSYMHYLYLGKK